MKKLPENTAKHLYEGVFIILSAVAVLMLLALFSFHPEDPAWSYVGSYESINNFGGSVGAWFADVVLYGFGYLAYLLPFLLMYGAWRMILGKDHARSDYRVMIIRSLGFIFIVASVCSLANIGLSQFSFPMPASAGGVVGAVISASLQSAFNQLGTVIFSLAILLTGVTFSIGFSWLRLLENIGRWVLCIMRKIADLMTVTAAKIHQAMQYINTKCRQRIILRRKPVVIAQAHKLPVELVARQAKPKIVSKAVQLTTSKRYEQERQVPLFDAPLVGSLPALTLLDPTEKPISNDYSNAQLEELSRAVEQCLLDFGIKTRVVAVNPGPVVIGLWTKYITSDIASKCPRGKTYLMYTSLFSDQIVDTF